MHVKPLPTNPCLHSHVPFTQFAFMSQRLHLSSKGSNRQLAVNCSAYFVFSEYNVPWQSSLYNGVLMGERWIVLFAYMYLALESQRVEDGDERARPRRRRCPTPPSHFIQSHTYSLGRFFPLTLSLSRVRIKDGACAIKMGSLAKKRLHCRLLPDRVPIAFIAVSYTSIQWF